VPVQHASFQSVLPSPHNRRAIDRWLPPCPIEGSARAEPVGFQPLFATWPGAPTRLNNASMQLTTSNHWLASARGRLGWTGDNWMIYGTGGAAFTQTSYGAALNRSFHL
jgi:opacity protein-like surface antigen